MMKVRKMRWKGHVACLKEIRNAFKVCLEILKGKIPCGRLCTAGRIVLKQIIEKKVGWQGLDSTGSGWGTVTGPCEHSGEPSDSRNGRMFQHELSEYQFRKSLLCYDFVRC
jgi:hypothetical protein